MLANGGGPFRLQLFHLGHLFKRPVIINIMRDGIPTPVPYSPNLFDYGRVKFDKPLPVNLGFAGFRLHYPLNRPGVFDELVSFVGSSYFRLLGRGQQYGLSARSLSLNTGLLDNKEEFPFFREFWFDTPGANADHVTILALLDSDSVAGAYRFDVYPALDSRIDVQATVFARSPQSGVGAAPLTSMFFMGENDRHYNDRNKYDDFRPEMHDSDGLQIETAGAEWLWRPLRNPFIQKVSYFDADNVKGFGLVQRDRLFDHYQDIELAYESRPTYWIEPKGKWGEGRLELVELATRDETADNVILSWRPKEDLTPEKPATFAYRLTSMLDAPKSGALGQVLNTFSAPPVALGSGEHAPAGARRFMAEFVGGDIPYYVADPSGVEIVATAPNGKVYRSFLTPNLKIRGLRAHIDVQVKPGDSTDLRMFLRVGGRPLTETWVYAFNDEHPEQFPEPPKP
jgi:glucans biosynthesis protein